MTNDDKDKIINLDAFAVCRLQGWTGNPNVPEQHNEHNPDMNVKVLHSFAEAGDLSFLKALQGK